MTQLARKAAINPQNINEQYYLLNQIVTGEVAKSNTFAGRTSYTVQKALEKVEGVHNLEVSYATKEATVRFDDTKTNVLMLIEATTNAGYSSSVKTDATNER